MSSSSSASGVQLADFQLPARYEVTRAVGRGAFGTLVAARDHTMGKTVAVKKVEGGGGSLCTNRQDTKKLAVANRGDEVRVETNGKWEEATQSGPSNIYYLIIISDELYTCQTRRPKRTRKQRMFK